MKLFGMNPACALLAGIAALGWECCVHAESSAAGQIVEISLQQCVDRALARNFAVQSAKLAPDLALYELRAYSGAYDPELAIHATRKFVDQPATFDPKKLTTTRAGLDLEYELTQDSIGPSLQGRLPTGLRYDLYARSDRFDSTTVPSLRTNNFYGAVGITLSQPLLRDLWIDADRRNLRLARKSLKISEWQLREQLIGTVTEVKLAYYSLVLAHEEVKVQHLRLDVANRLAADVHKRVEAHGLSELEEPRIASQVELVKTTLFGAEQNEVARSRALWNLISDDYVGEGGVGLRPLDTLIFLEEHPSPAESRQTALQSRPDLREMQLHLEKQEIVLTYNKNELLPDLSVTGGYGRHSIQHEFGETVEEIANHDHSFYSVGATLRFPLGNISARNRLKASKVAKEQLVFGFRKLQQDVLVEVDTDLSALETAAKQIDSSRKAREFAELALAAEEKSFNFGKSTTFLVMERQSALAEARLVELRSVGAYNIARAQLDRAEGITLSRSGVDLSLQ